MKKYLLIISGLILCGQTYWIMMPMNSAPPLTEAKVVFPDFTLPSLFNSQQIISPSELKKGNITVINFFASWCGPCKIEHPLLMELTRQGVSILGINYQDSEKSAQRFLKEKGNPYKLTAWDKKGTMGMRWGIMSIPQTFVINKKGHILYHRSGRLHPENITNDILPLLKNN